MTTYDDHQNEVETTRLVAPICTVLFVRKSGGPNSGFSKEDGVKIENNIPKGQNWTDIPEPSSVVLVQQPQGQPKIHAALLGDIMTTRLKSRGVLGAMVNGRIRDVESCRATCADNHGDTGAYFHLWSRGFSASSPTLEVLPWAVGVPLQFGAMTVQQGDILCADEGDRAVVVIPRELLGKVVESLAVQKNASEAVLEKVKKGQSIPEAVAQHPDFYSAYSHR